MTAKKTVKKTPKISKVANNLPTPKFLRPKPIKVVTRKVLQNIADGIYNPMTNQFLNLCSGTLQNGPDPVCETRTMHCGLGELYFVVTGQQPEETGADENDVVQEVIERSTIHECAKLNEKKVLDLNKKIKNLKLPTELQDQLLSEVNAYDWEDPAEKFETILVDIPTENDQGGSSSAAFESRAKRVAAALRKAAALLPR